MQQKVCFLIRREDLKKDPAFQFGARGAKKVLVTEIYPDKEQEVCLSESPLDSCGKVPVQIMKDSEIAFFNQNAGQDKHYHKEATEIYTVLEGEMDIIIQGQEYTLLQGDTIVVHPNAVHKIKSRNVPFLTSVITINCHGVYDKFILHDHERFAS